MIWEAVVMSVSAVRPISLPEHCWLFSDVFERADKRNANNFAMDTIVTPLTLVLIVAASIISAAFGLRRGCSAARGSEILREA